MRQEYTQAGIHIYSLTHTQRQASLANLSTGIILGHRMKLENSKETHISAQTVSQAEGGDSGAVNLFI